MVFCMCFSARERTFVLNPTKDRNGRRSAKDAGKADDIEDKPCGGDCCRNCRHDDGHQHITRIFDQAAAASFCASNASICTGM